MSNITLNPNASGTGTFSVASPNSNTDRTLTLPDSDGELVSLDSSGNFSVEGGDVSFYEDTGTTPKFFWDASAESLGIGTSSPTFTSGYGGVHIANDYAEIHLTNSSSGSTASDGFKVQQNSANNAYLWNYENAFIAFGTANAERMRIDSSGNLLVGTTSSFSPSYRMSIAPHPSTGFIVYRAATTANHIPAAFLNSSGSGVGNIVMTTTSTAYNTSSDYRLKTDAQPMTGASARVQALNPVNFEWIADGTRVDGFLAHEAQEVVPEAVHGTKDAMMDEEYEVTPAVLDDDGNVVTEAVMGTRSVPDYQGIDQSKLVPLLTAALQEALTEITDLKARVAALEAM